MGGRETASPSAAKTSRGRGSGGPGTGLLGVHKRAHRRPTDVAELPELYRRQAACTGLVEVGKLPAHAVSRAIKTICRGRTTRVASGEGAGGVTEQSLHLPYVVTTGDNALVYGFPNM